MKARPPAALLLAATLALGPGAACSDGQDLGAPPRADAGPFARTGLIEGYYGEPYRHVDRLELLRFLGERGLSHYVYAPKNDPLHRTDWRAPYPADALARFGELVAEAETRGVTFSWAVTPAGVVFTSEADFAALVAKLDQLASVGVRSFTLSFDDLLPVFDDPRDWATYGLELGTAHAELANRVLAHLRERDPGVELLFTPLDYNGTVRPYTFQVGAVLEPSVPVFWTGPSVFSPTIDEASLREVAAAMQRPPLIWDNFPVNDTVHALHLHLGPYVGREPGLARVVDGIVLNTMAQARASRVALHELARFAEAPFAYDPDRAWAEGLVATAGASPAFRLLAEQARASPLDPTESVALERAVDGFFDAWDGGGPELERAATELGALFDSFATIRAALEAEVADRDLLAEVEPWVDKLVVLGGLGRAGLDRMLASRDERPAPVTALRLEAMALESELSPPERMCGDAVARFLDEGAGALRRAP